MLINTFSISKFNNVEVTASTSTCRNSSKHCVTPFENVDSASTFVGVQYSAENGTSVFVEEQQTKEMVHRFS